MSRAPELGDECRPGGSCPECNAPSVYCAECGDELDTTDEGSLCDYCAAEIAEERTCDWCDGPSGEMRYCSAACRRAAESDHA